MSGELSFLLAYIATYIGVIPSLLAMFRVKGPIPEHRLLSVLVWGGTGIGIIASILATFQMTNLYLLHLYTIFNFVMISILFRPFVDRKIFLPLSIGFCVFALIYSIWVEQLQTMNVLNRSISAFIIMFYTLSFFLKTLRDLKVQRLELMPLFWVSIGALFYNAGSFFIFLFSKDISPFEELWHTYFGIHSAFTILLYTFYTVALWVRPKT